MTEVLVIGSGPAGLAAACAARALGRRVVLLDASDYVGGQYWRHLPPERPARREAVLHHGWSRFQAMSQALERDPLCEIVTSAHVWAIDAGRVHVMVGEADGAGREARTYAAAAVVFATGAFDRALPIPGWDLPGVFTAGGAQALAKGERVAVGQRVVVAGSGPFLLPVASSLVQAGSTVVGVYEASHLAHLARQWTARPWQLLATPAKLLELAHYASVHVKNRIPYATGRAVTAIHGGQRVESVTISAIDETWRPIPGGDVVVAADAVCLGHGFTPRVELPIAAGCRLDARRFVQVDEHQRTSVAAFYAAGEITGIGGVDLSLSEGTIAGHMAAGGHLEDRALRDARARRDALRSFAERLERAHRIGENWTDWLSDETIVCRCEEVSVGRLRSVAETSRSSGLRSLKLQSRAGLGACQGRMCGRSVETILAAAAPGGHLIDESTTDRRPIATPIRLAELAFGNDKSVEK
ncbi:MAG: FAD-dependent oxidoreductase [Acidimicrobiaceae bacterium]|nr:FAD-dependent oxidoreductase [Acidimicrobiaceae bacterium]